MSTNSVKHDALIRELVANNWGKLDLRGGVVLTIFLQVRSAADSVDDDVYQVRRAVVDVLRGLALSGETIS